MQTDSKQNAGRFGGISNGAAFAGMYRVTKDAGKRTP